MTELPVLYTLEQVAEQTGFRLRTLQQDCRAGRVAHVHRGRQRFMTADQVHALVARHVKEPPPPLPHSLEARIAAARDRVQRVAARDARRSWAS